MARPECDVAQEAVDAGESYSHTLMRSMSTALEEIYAALHHAAMSALTGEGVDGVWDRVRSCAEEFEKEYLPMMQREKVVLGGCAMVILAGGV